MESGADCYRRFLDGDESAFDEILSAYRLGLIYFIDRYVHDIPTAEDIAMDTFMELIVHRHRYNFNTSLKTYLFMMGRSRALDHLKHRRTITMVDLSEAENTAEDAVSLEQRVLNNEQKRAVHTAIGRLPEAMQTAVHLVYFEEMTYAQAAAVMKKSPKQVDNLLYRAKKELRTILKGEEITL